MARAPRTDCLRAVVLAGLALAVVASGTGAGSPLASSLAAGGQVDPDSVLLEASLHPDGDATWEVRYRVRLEDDNATAAFESLEADVRENRSGFERQFAERMAGTVAAAENATGREMALRNVTVETVRQDLGQRYGVLVYRFEWTNFAAANETTIKAGDAVGGLYLDEETAFTVRWPSEYDSVSVDPATTLSGEQSATWRGPREFATDQPRIVVSTDSTATSGPAMGATGPPLALVLGGLLAVLLAGGGAVWLTRRRGSTTAGDEEHPDDLLSNEERVLQLLRENGGRMKQQQVVEELGWTDAKTSQVVGDLRDSGEVEGFRLGRENVLRLPDDES